MRRSIPFGTLLILTLVLSAAGQVSAKAGRAKLRIAPDMFDFGYIPPGFKVTNKYWLVNDGADTLVVAAVKPQCGCTAAPLTKDRVSPKDSVPLDVVFDTKNITGVINKKVTVVSNSSTGDSTVLYFTGRIEATDTILAIEPRAALFTEIDKRKEIIKLRNISRGEFRVRLAAPPPGFIECSLSADLLPPGGSMTVTLTRGKGTPVGEYVASVTLVCDAPIPLSVSIPIKGLGYVE